MLIYIKSPASTPETVIVQPAPTTTSDDDKFGSLSDLERRLQEGLPLPQEVPSLVSSDKLELSLEDYSARESSDIVQIEIEFSDEQLAQILLCALPLAAGIKFSIDVSQALYEDAVKYTAKKIKDEAKKTKDKIKDKIKDILNSLMHYLCGNSPILAKKLEEASNSSDPNEKKEAIKSRIREEPTEVKEAIQTAAHSLLPLLAKIKALKLNLVVEVS